jgi:hypothetical protein
MATTPKRVIGTMDCWSCGKEIPVRQADHGTLHFACQWCGFGPYAKKGEEVHGNVLKALKTRAHDPTPEPAKPAAPAANPAPAPRRASSIFDLGTNL